MKRANVLGVRFVAEPFAVVRREVGRLLESAERRSAYLCPTGAHGVIEARKDDALRSILNRADFTVLDGMSVVYAARTLGFSGSERAFGPDIMWAILEDSLEAGVRHFFYGGSEGVAPSLEASLRRRLPGLKVVGTYTPPFRALSEREEAEIAHLINQSGADVVWVGLSTPKQERWIGAFRDRLNVKLICSVGAAFDYHNGSLRPAPRWMQAAALEWLFRLVQEPRRLWRRYFKVVPSFLMLFTMQLSGVRRFSDDT